jgi:hypothetical protein
MKYIVWIKENGAWVEQGDGPLTKKTAERIARELREDFGSKTEVRPASEGSPPLTTRDKAKLDAHVSLLTIVR